MFFTTISYSQNAFTEYQFDAKRGSEAAILALTDEFWGDAEFKSGGINIESFNIGNNESSHRIVLYGDPANWEEVTLCQILINGVFLYRD